MFQEAAETAARSKDSDMLSKIQGLVGALSQASASDCTPKISTCLYHDLRRFVYRCGALLVHHVGFCSRA